MGWHSILTDGRARTSKAWGKGSSSTMGRFHVTLDAYRMRTGETRVMTQHWSPSLGVPEWKTRDWNSNPSSKDGSRGDLNSVPVCAYPQTTN